jgi:RNA polymerase sigma factor (sigma-70 family)
MAATETSARANEVLDEIYRQHVGDVYRYTYAVLGNHADAEDVTQTTFVNALRALERGEVPRDASRWLLVIAHNVVRQRWRQAASKPTLVELAPDVPADVDDDVNELDDLVRALQRIPETQREALVMRELEGRSYREIAELLGLTTSALETLLFRARRSLAEELENVVTCENAERALSQRLDGRLSRKDRRRLDEHLAECPECARLAAAQQRQRRTFKGLALLPLPIGLALFKGAPNAAAATSLPTIGLGSAGAGTSGTGAAGTAGAGATAAATTGGAAVGGSLAGVAVVKVAAVVVAATVAAGVGYKGVQAVRDTPPKAPPAKVEKAPEKRDTPAAPAATHTRRAGSVDNAKGHGKPASSPGRAKHGDSPQPGLAKSQSAKIPDQNNSSDASSSSSTGGNVHVAGRAEPGHVHSPAHPNKPAASNDSKAPNGKETQSGTPEHSQAADHPVTPKAPKSPTKQKTQVSGGPSPKPKAPSGGGSPAPAPGATTPPPGGAAPTGGAVAGATPPPATGAASTGAPAVSAPTGTPPQTQEPAPSSTSTPPASTPPASTPPASTPPNATPPTTTPPPADQAPPATTPPPADQTPQPPTQPPPTSPPGDTTGTPVAPSGSPDGDGGHDHEWWTWWLWWLRHHGGNNG